MEGIKEAMKKKKQAESLPLEIMKSDSH